MSDVVELVVERNRIVLWDDIFLDFEGISLVGAGCELKGNKCLKFNEKGFWDLNGDFVPLIIERYDVHGDQMLVDVYAHDLILLEMKEVGVPGGGVYVSRKEYRIIDCRQ